MKSYVWILGTDKEPHLKGTGGVSAAYVLPESYAPAEPTDLAGCRIWMVLRGSRGDALFTRVSVEIVEQFSDVPENDLNVGDYLLTVDFRESYRCSVSYASGHRSFSTDETLAFSLGLREVSAGFFETLSAKAEGAVTTNLRKPDDRTLDRIVKPLSPERVPLEAENAMAATIGHFSLEEVWAGRPPELPPFANFTYHAIAKVHGETVAGNLTGELSRLDPTVTNPLASIDTDAVRDQARRPVVDVNLLSIDPDCIFARRFIARRNFVDPAEAVKKTEHAEKRHQDMLRDMAKRLIELGFSPMQSSSIDLFTATKTGVACFELKTTTRQNFLDQTAKGVFQLACYKIALVTKGYHDAKPILVMETTGVGELDSYILDVVRTLDMQVLFYDADRSWPDRLKGLDDVLES